MKTLSEIASEDFTMVSKKSEAIIIRNRGGKLVEVRLIPCTRKQEKTDFASDGVVCGSMETKPIPERFNSLLEWLDNNGKLHQVEEMLGIIFQ